MLGIEFSFFYASDSRSKFPHQLMSWPLYVMDNLKEKLVFSTSHYMQ